MLNIFRRHRRTCKGWERGRRWWKCTCPISAEGSLEGKIVRRTLGTNNWERAKEIVAGWTRSGPEGITDPHGVVVTTKGACEAWIEEVKARQLAESTTRKHRALMIQITQFAQANSLDGLGGWDLEATAKFRRTWADQNMSAYQKLARLRSFMQFCLDRGWIRENWARKLEMPQTRQVPTMPFTSEQITAIFGACATAPKLADSNRVRVKAFISLLRYSGLRIQDAVTLARNRMTDGKILLYQAKTGTPVYCPLPPEAVSLLNSLKNPAGEYFFWSGTSTPEAATSVWRKTLSRVFKAAGIEDGHAHRFRDTFAVELLLASVPIDRVSILLGHSSVRITEKHYSPWVRARQEQLEADVRRTWANVAA